jgi:uncharacterized protein
MKRILFFLFAFFGAGGASALAPIPELTSPVIDNTVTLSREQIRELAEQSFELQREKGSQLQILLIPSTQPENIAQYSQRVFDKWKLGREKANDGVLLIVAKEDRQVRIHVGYGLESDIPDITASRIINERIIPYFKRNDYAGGVIEGAATLRKVIRGAELLLPTPEKSIAKQQGTNWFLWFVFSILLTIIAIVSIVAFYVQSGRKNTAKPEPIPDEDVLTAKKTLPEMPAKEPPPSIKETPPPIKEPLPSVEEPSLSMSVRASIIKMLLAESLNEVERKPKKNNEVIQNDKIGVVAFIFAMCVFVAVSSVFFIFDRNNFFTTPGQWTGWEVVPWLILFFAVFFAIISFSALFIIAVNKYWSTSKIISDKDAQNVKKTISAPKITKEKFTKNILSETVQEIERNPKKNNEVIQSDNIGTLALILAMCVSVTASFVSFIFIGDSFSDIFAIFCIVFVFVFFLVIVVSLLGTADVTSSSSFSSSRDWSIPSISWDSSSSSSSRNSSSSSSWSSSSSSSWSSSSSSSRSSSSSSSSGSSWSGGGGRSGGGGASGSW